MAAPLRCGPVLRSFHEPRVRGTSAAFHPFLGVAESSIFPVHAMAKAMFWMNNQGRGRAALEQARLAGITSSLPSRCSQEQDSSCAGGIVRSRMEKSSEEGNSRASVLVHSHGGARLISLAET